MEEFKIIKNIMDQIKSYLSAESVEVVTCPKTGQVYPFIQVNLGQITKWKLRMQIDLSIVINSFYQGSKEVLDLSQRLYALLKNWTLKEDDVTAAGTCQPVDYNEGKNGMRQGVIHMSIRSLNPKQFENSKSPETKGDAQ